MIYLQSFWACRTIHELGKGHDVQAALENLTGRLS